MAIKKHRPVHILPELYDISPFLRRDHPTYHPSTKEYEQYWLQHEKHIVEGLWGEDKKVTKEKTFGGWRFMPNTLYFMINLGTMIHEDEESNTNIEMQPICRDIDWVMDYGYMVSRGFSGFEWDEENTSHRIIRSVEEKGYKNISPEEKILLDQYRDVLVTPRNTWKKYKDPIEYLYQTFPENLGKAKFDNQALNFMLFGPRGFGKSWKAAHIFMCEFQTSGMKVFDDRYLFDQPAIELMMLSTITGKTAETLDKFSKIEKHLENLGSWGSGEDFIPGYFYLNTKGTLDNNNMKKPYTHRYSVLNGSVWNHKAGTGNKIYNVVATVSNPDVGAGPRPILILHEEAGLAKNESVISAVNQNSLKKETKVGTEMLIGTGGNFLKIGDIKKKWNNAKANKLVEYKDLWRNSNNPIGCFIPKTHVKLKFKDKNGNTNVEMSLAQELHERRELMEAGDPEKLRQHIVYNCLTPEEMFAAATSNIFPTEEINETIFDIESKFTDYNKRWRIGYFADHNQNDFVWIEDRKMISSMYTNPHDDDNKSNNFGITIYQEFIKNNKMDSFYFNPYKIVYDSVKDEGGGVSLASITVYKGFIEGEPIDEFTDNIVATYVGRINDTEKIHLIAIQLAKYYRCKVLFENNIYDFAKWCYRSGYGEYLQWTPWLAIDKQISNASKKYKVGVNIQGPLKDYCIRLLKTKVGEKNTLDDVNDPKLWIQRVKDLRLLYELSLYGDLKNYDSISSMLVLMLWLDQEKDPRLSKIIGSTETESTIVESLVKDLNKIENEFTWGEY